MQIVGQSRGLNTPDISRGATLYSPVSLTGDTKHDSQAR